MTPLEGTVARLDGVVPHLGLRVGAPRDWAALDGLDEAALEDWYTVALDRLGDRAAAALAVGSEIGQTAVVAWVLPHLVGRQIPLVGPEGIALHYDDHGRLDGVAWEEAPLASGGGPEAIADQVIAPLLGLEEPFERLRRVVRVGRPALWGSVADLITSYALGTARALDAHREEAWAAAEEVVEGLAQRQPELRSRPRPLPITFSGGEEWFGVRGTCCLWYRTCLADSRKAYCITCPLRSDDDRTERLRTYLEG